MKRLAPILFLLSFNGCDSSDSTFFVWWIVLSVTVAFVGYSRDKSFIRVLLISLLLSPVIGLIALLWLPKKTKSEQKTTNSEPKKTKSETSGYDTNNYEGL